ncbi:hypothetical protein NEOLEDRAFT_1167499 [Neolentinus lepideus HHB14362 ss-1]|uniref:Uncharacterized protein n=1 Tax=Neolentinus lepideus HHB14362 ss-1 TaxID=1314782 RepID=A0A165URU2_9AGAM|nr:hypothetical protein NEOLEDRAFT_1167499 [Neolentinus lepideus HHB14362 ss-1]
MRGGPRKGATVNGLAAPGLFQEFFGTTMALVHPIENIHFLAIRVVTYCSVVAENSQGLSHMTQDLRAREEDGLGSGTEYGQSAEKTSLTDKEQTAGAFEGSNVIGFNEEQGPAQDGRAGQRRPDGGWLIALVRDDDDDYVIVVVSGRFQPPFPFTKVLADGGDPGDAWLGLVWVRSMPQAPRTNQSLRVSEAKKKDIEKTIRVVIPEHISEVVGAQEHTHQGD